MYELFIHQLKEKIRSPFWQRSIFLNIVLGFMGLYFITNILFVSLFADKILPEFYTDRTVVEAFTGLLFYYFSFDLIIRFLFQQLPTLSIQPYLTVPIKKSQLLHYPLLISTTSFFNVLAVLLVLPFFFKNICCAQSSQFSLTWIVFVLSMIGVNNFLNFSLKKYFSKKPLMTLLFLVGLGLIVYLDYTKIVTFSGYFIKGVYFMSRHAFLIVVPLLMVALSYYFAYTFLRKNAYIEDSINRVVKQSKALSIFDKYGEIGQLIGIQVKMILRNKRPRSLLYVSSMFILYGFLFYKEDNMNNYFILSFIGLLVPYMFSISYAQYLFSWDSSFFDSILVSRIKPYNYIKSKYMFFLITSIIGYFIFLPFALISYKIALINGAFLLFNLGITSIILLYFCTFNTSYIDLGKGQFMNFQGISAAHYLIMLPIMLLPVIIYLLLKLFGGADYYFHTIAIVGLLGIALNKYILKLILNQFVKKKYKMALGFRQR